MRKLTLILLTSVLLTARAIPAIADNWRWHGDIHGFREYDYDHWRSGQWVQGRHAHRFGWWWVVGGFWYSYPAPVYPYPDPYTPPMIAVEPTPPGMAPAYVYYCQNPAGYFPYVPECYGPWQKVASGAVAVPPMMQQAPVMQQQAPAMQQQAPVMQAPPMAMPAGPISDQRKLDDRQLNAFGVEFQSIDLHDRHARTKLGTLESQVESFRQSLFQRSYNAMDIMKDAEDLEHRISAQRGRLPGHDDGANTLPPSASVPPLAPNSSMMAPSQPPTWSPPPQQ